MPPSTQTRRAHAAFISGGDYRRGMAHGQGAAAPYQCGTVSLVYLSSRSRRTMDYHTQGADLHIAVAISATCQTPESVTKRCFSIAAPPLHSYNIGNVYAS